MTRDPIPPQRCPQCNGAANAAARYCALTEPVPGDYLICTHCASMLVFDERLVCRLPSAAELETMRKDPAWQLALRERVRILSERFEREMAR